MALDDETARRKIVHLILTQQQLLDFASLFNAEIIQAEAGDDETFVFTVRSEAFKWVPVDQPVPELRISDVMQTTINNRKNALYRIANLTPSEAFKAPWMAREALDG